MSDDRLRKLEEDASFTDRTVDELSKQVFDMTRRMESLAGKLESLEDRISGLIGDEDGIDVPDAIDDVPPHAAGGPNRPTE